ncbi:MAG: hypothetical protein ACRDGQ_10610 [Candidatus Limnocylindrales bacterium]
MLTYPSNVRFFERDALYPAAYIASHPIGEQLDQTRDGGAADLGGQVVESLATMVANQQAIVYYIAEPAEIYRVQAFLVGERLVVMSVVGSPDKIGSPVADEFLDSVQLVP